MPETKLKQQEMTAPTWTAVTFQNNWVNYDSGFQQCQYTKDNNGWVHIRGLMKSGTVGAAAFTLPVGYRPSSTLGFVVDGAATFGRIYISAAGTVQPETPTNNGFVFLDSIHFYAG